jgi:DNA helicase HerA-like ATPase
MKTDLTFLGVVRKVVGNKVFVEISDQIPSSNPIINGKIYRLGQIGSFVKIPLGFHYVYGIISMVGSNEISNDKDQESILMKGQRWIEISLFGESYANQNFQRGISNYPTIEDEVHIVTENDLAIIYDTDKRSMIEIGHHASSENLPATVDIDKIVNRHCAILGSTGSGKSNTVATILRSLINNSFSNARIIIIDPHGEYSTVFQEKAKIFSVNSNNLLKIPYWVLSFDELGSILVDRKSASASQPDIVLRDKIFEEKKENCQKLKSGKIDPSEITADSPIPFNLKQLWYDLFVFEHATLYEKDDFTKISYKKDLSGNEIKGNVLKVIPPEFLPPNPGSAAPHKTQRGCGLSSYLTKIMGRLRDKRYDFLFNVDEYNGSTKDLHDLLVDWVGHDKPITIFDLSGIPFEIMDLIVGTISRIIFEGMFWGRDIDGMGRQRPILFIFEEAHAYLPRSTSQQFVTGYSNIAVRRIFKEGRKYGIGSIIVSQRPSDLDPTILSQCGTFISLRLTNGQDQATIKSAVPDALSTIIDLLSTLRTGEAIIVGEGVQMPCRVRFALIEPRPKSNDPEVAKCWSAKCSQDVEYNKAVTGWRAQKMVIKTKPEGGKNG